MAEHTRLAAAGLFLALTLAVVPALLPVNLARAGSGPRVQAAAQFLAAAPLPAAARTPALVHLRGGEFAPPQTTPASPAPSESVLRIAMSQAAPRDHTVAPGETLWRISQDAGIGVDALRAANHLTLGALLHAGQVLMVPPVDPWSKAGQTHEVAPGETLWGISRAAGLRVETLAAANHLTLDALLHPGQTLVVPSQDISASAAAVVRRSGARELAPAADSGLSGAPLSLPPGVDFRSLGQPSEGMITSRFGWRTHPIFGTREFHTGVDIANHMGTPIRSAEAGIVRFVGWMSGYGRLVIVTHGNGLETSYSHLSSMLVRLGQRVIRGQVLGLMGSTGWSTGPHLFFEIRRNGLALDPAPFLRGTTTSASATDTAPATPSTVVEDAQGGQPAAAQGAHASASQGGPASASSAAPAPASAAAQSDEHRTISGTPEP